MPIPGFDPADITAQLDVTTAAFLRRFRQPPRIAAVAPGRVNLIGEHTDYNGGFVLPIAIERQVVVAAGDGEPDRSTFLALNLDEETSIDLTHPLAPVSEPRWANYLTGVVNEFLNQGFAVPNLNLAISSTVPIGAGLSSSAAVEVAVATVLEQMLGVELEPLEKALLCQRAEHRFPGTPCGIMDMCVSSMARPGQAMLIDCRTNAVEHIPMPAPDRATLLIVDTGVRHDLASSAYGSRRTMCAQTAAALGLPLLRDATPERLDQAGLSSEARQRAQHVVEEIARTAKAAQLLAADDLEGFGTLMFESHESLRRLYEVSCPELDTLVEESRTLRERGEPVFGARMTGGGFGGCMIVFVHPNAEDHVRNRLMRAYTATHDRSATIFATSAAGGARVASLTP